MKLKALCWHDLQNESKQEKSQDKETILAFHGWLDNAASFTPMAPYLKDYRLIAFDFLGHGRSKSLPKGMFHHFLDSIHLIYQIAEELKLKKFIIMGHSMGGVVAGIFAGTFPNMISKMVLIEGPLMQTTEYPPTFSIMRKSVKQFSRISKSVPKGSHDLEDLIKAKQKAENLTYEASVLLTKRSTIKRDGLYFWRNDPRLYIDSFLKFGAQRSSEFIENIHCPTLSIRGEDGFFLNEKKFPKHLKKMPHLKRVSIPGGHHLHMDSPQETSTAVLEFLSKKDNGHP